jgi:hypothetical protein
MNRQRQTNRRFCVLKENHENLVKDNKSLFKKIKLLKIQVIDELKTRMESQRIVLKSNKRHNSISWNNEDTLLDRFYKNTLIFFENRGIFNRNDFKNGILTGYLEDEYFDPGLNVNLMGEKKVQEFFSFVEAIDFIVNENLVVFFRNFLKFSLDEYLYNLNILPSSLSVPLYRKNMQYITSSSHLYIQRAVLPFKRAREVELRLGILSWNIAGKDLTKEENVINRITRDMIISNLDLIVFGFQEIVELKLSFMNLNKMMFQCMSISNQIKNILEKNLGDEFVCLGLTNLMGLFQVIFLRRDRLADVDWYYHRDWKLKLGGTKAIKMGNKGVIAQMIQINGFGKLTFINSHLVHGFDKVNKRVEQFDEVISKLQSKDN